MDIRFADQTSLAGAPLVYGASLNNNPGVQDLWNTTPVWGFPFDSSPLAPAPAAATLIQGGLGQVSVGATAYGLWNDQVYVEAGLYHILSQSVIDALTGSADGVPKSDGVAPYWRLVWQQESGSQSLELGTFGLHAALYPNAIKIAGSDTFTDIGFRSPAPVFLRQQQHHQSACAHPGIPEPGCQFRPRRGRPSHRQSPNAQ